MQIQVNTDDNVEGREALAARVRSTVEAAIGRFADGLTRVEVHLGDVNAGRSGSADKRCLMEARPAGGQPVAVTHHAATVEEACDGAARKLRNLLDSQFGKAADVKGATSIRDNEHR